MTSAVSGEYDSTLLPEVDHRGTTVLVDTPGPYTLPHQTVEQIVGAAVATDSMLGIYVDAYG